MFKNITFYTLPQGFDFDANGLNERLASNPFVECPKVALESKGWLPIAGLQGQFVTQAQGSLLFSLGFQKKSLPAKLIKMKLDKAMKEFKERHSEMPKGKDKLEMKDKIKEELTVQAFAVPSDVQIMVDKDRKWLALNTSSAGQAEKAIKQLREALPPGALKTFALRPIKIPADVLSSWLLKSPPSGFSLDGDATFKDEEGGKITCKSQDLNSQEIITHSETHGVISLSLSSESCFFTLNEKLVLSSLKFTSELTTDYEQPDSEEGAAYEAYMQSMVILFRQEFNVLFNVLVNNFDCKQEG